MRYEGVLGRQSFAGSDLIRHGGLPTREKITTQNGFYENVRIALVSEKQIEVCKASEEGEYILAWHSINDFIFSGFTLGPDAGSKLDVLYFHDVSNSSSTIEVPLYYLGSTEDSIDNKQGAVHRSYYVCDISIVKNKNLPLPVFPKVNIFFLDLRTLLPQLRYEDLAYAGHAVALTQWHQTHQFCSKCGAPTASISDGQKRQCLENPSHRHYPRTDPVIITLVLLEQPSTTSPGSNTTTEKALLGRSKGLPPGTLTCLSGFVDQGESIEEAVAREVKEESGVIVHSVEILGSQPWPIGRGGSCELMIGCLASTYSEILNVDFTEMAECRWVEKKEIINALNTSLHPNSPFINRKERNISNPSVGESDGTENGQIQDGMDSTISTSSASFFVPPPFAIAHHLLRYWAENKVESRQSVVSNRQSNM